MKKYSYLLFVLFIIALFLGGCAVLRSGPDTPDPERLAQIGYQLQQNPGDSEQILKQHDLSQQEFTEQMQRISSEPQLAEQYRDEFYRLMEED